VEHETLDLEEVKKVIKGQPIRGIEAVISEDISRMTDSPPAAMSSNVESS
jgi:ATP-dependent metalloprotease